MRARLAQIEYQTRSRERMVGLGLVEGDGVAEEAIRLLNLPPELARKMTALDCGLAAFTLGQFAVRVQHQFNAHHAAVRWADANLREVAGDSEAALRMKKVRAECDYLASSYHGIAERAEGLAKSMMALQSTRRGER